MAENCYLLADTATYETLIIDPGDDPEYISEIILREKLKPVKIVATHGHFDHVLGVRALQLAFNLPFFINKKDQFLVSRAQSTAARFLQFKKIDPSPWVTDELKDRGKLTFGKSCLTAIATPGHTPGGMSLYSAKSGMVFVGDLAFAGGSVGRTDFVYADAIKLRKSLKKILSLPENTIVYPGHGEATRVTALRKLLSV